ncbi:MAG: VWA domain-containing protein [Pyrinomonadaceae bacterium]|nr:VWA domain-containing protein [Pyrinomonadaceae bacterium]
MENYSRRLPVYLLLDTSESMAGPAIEAVQQGVRTLVGELATNPLALETAYMSVITFSREAKQIIPLTELTRFQPPPLRVRPGTALGGALRLLSERLRSEVMKTTETTKGDYKPLVFLLTDGQPTDDWEQAADSIKAPGASKTANIYAIGCGPDVDSEVLYRITETVLLMPNLTPEAIRKFFVWLSASVQAVSTKIEATASAGAINLPAPPSGALEVAPRTTTAARRGNKSPRQVFLHALCSKVRKPYLMRFVRREYEERYDAVAAHKLEALEEGDTELLPPINSSLLFGCPSCPYCENPIATMCPCGALFCTPPGEPPTLVCPKCNSELVMGDGKDFDITRADG